MSMQTYIRRYALIDEGRPPRTAKAGRDKAHSLVDAETEEESNGNLQGLLDTEFSAKNGFQHQKCHVE